MNTTTQLVRFGVPNPRLKSASQFSSWSPLSERASETNFAPVNSLDVLERWAAIPIRAERIARDLDAAFGLGENH